MKKFLGKSLLLFGIIIVLTGSVSLFDKNRKESNEYMAVLTDKHHRINAISGRKIILAGGSNLVFGMDSQKIEEEFTTPVVNLGLHAKLGLRFILNELKDVAKQDDIIILSIEHDMTIEGNLELQKMTSFYNPFAYSYYKESDHTWVEQFISSLDDKHLIFKKTISDIIDKVKNDPVYTRDGLNKYGDGVHHLDLPSSSVLGSKSILKDTRDAEIKVLNDFYDFARSKEITVLFSYGAYEISEYKKNKAALKKVHQKMKQSLKIEMITDLQDFVYPTSYFYDSVYHLNKKGRTIHTQNLIKKIHSSTAFQVLKK